MNYDGNKVVSWADCDWKPLHLRNRHTLDALNKMAADLMNRSLTLPEPMLEIKIVNGINTVPLTDEQKQQLRHRGYTPR